MPQKPTVQKDIEQEPFEVDQIECPRCGQIQTAKVYPERKRFQKFHIYTNCGKAIQAHSWKSLNQ